LPKKPPKPPQVPLSLVMAAVEAAGLSAAQRARFDTVMERGKPRRGRKPNPQEGDDALFAEVETLMAGGLKAHAACNRVTRDLPGSVRSATKKRLYRRAGAIEEESQRVPAPVPRQNLASGSGAPPRQGGLSAEDLARLEQMRMKKA